MTLDQVSAALATALGQGAHASIPVMINVDGVEKHVVQIVYVKGDAIVAPELIPHADKILVNLAE